VNDKFIQLRDLFEDRNFRSVPEAGVGAGLNLRVFFFASIEVTLELGASINI
jgi:hypothetical protein